jgi:hypothetical protein
MRKRLILAFVLLTGLCLVSCTGANYGRIVPGETADHDMDGGIYRPELRYHISGPEVYPNALIGLHRDYRLTRGTLWKEVPMTPEKLRETVRFMKAKAFEFRMFPRGFDLLDTQGRKIGFWYSVPLARTFMRFEEDGSVMILTPELDTFEKLEYKDSKD